MRELFRGRRGDGAGLGQGGGEALGPRADLRFAAGVAPLLELEGFAARRELRGLGRKRGGLRLEGFAFAGEAVPFGALLL